MGRIDPGLAELLRVEDLPCDISQLVGLPPEVHTWRCTSSIQYPSCARGDPAAVTKSEVKCFKTPYSEALSGYTHS